MVGEIFGNTVNIINESAKEDNFSKWAPILSPVIVLLIFLIGQVLDEGKRRKESQRLLYYKVHLEPSLSELNVFFNHIDALVLMRNGVVRSDTRNSARSLVRIKQKIADKEQIFVDSCLLVLKPAYPSVFEKAKGLLNLFKDQVYHILENGDNMDAFGYNSYRNGARSDLITLLSIPALGHTKKDFLTPKKYKYHSWIKQ